MIAQLKELPSVTYVFNAKTKERDLIISYWLHKRTNRRREIYMSDVNNVVIKNDNVTFNFHNGDVIGTKLDNFDNEAIIELKKWS